ncbi:MAG: ABC transporter substrate-binding protein [Bradyrhizobium sp.]
MRRRELIKLLGGAAATAATTVAARAQNRDPMKRIGVMFSGVEDEQSARDLAAFKSGLQVLGWNEGVNLQIDKRWGANDPNRAQSAATDLVGLTPAVILASGTVALVALHKTTDTTAIVFTNVTDPVAGGFVASFSKPSGNITGFTPFEYNIGGKWLELIKEIAPLLTRVALFGDPNNHNFKGFQTSFETAAKSMSVEPITVAVRDVEDVNRSISSLAEHPNVGLIITAATFSMTYRKQIVELATKYKMPTIFWNRSQVVAGGLMSLGPDATDMHRRAASYVDRILKGEKAADLPVQEPTKVEMIINDRTANLIGLVVPPALMVRADEVID